MDKLPFIPDRIYRRSDIHDQYKGNRQSGISASAVVPFIFIFSGESGRQYGYKDGWDNKNIFTYTGEGQMGDMHYVKGNLALKDHLNQGKRVFLFEYVRKGFVKFICELEFYDADYTEAIDKNKNLRRAIRFFFSKRGAVIRVSPKALDISTSNQDEMFANNYIPNITERTGLVTSRVGQGAYRKRIIHRWEYQCAVTGFKKLDVLIASHIVPWAKSTNEERLDVHNGILLSPVYDALFDRHLISFDNKGKILLSDAIDTEAYLKIGVSGKERIGNLRQENQKYLERHGEVLNQIIIV